MATFNTTSGDGYVSCVNANWALARAGTGTLAADSTSLSQYAGSFQYLGSYNIFRLFYVFDTSSIPDGATITSATLYVYQKANVFGSDATIVAQQGTQGTSITTADFSAFSGSEYGHMSTNSAAAGYYAITFNSTGINDINKTGSTYICVRDYDYDYLDTPPTGATMAFNAGFQEDGNPTYLDVQWTITSPSSSVSPSVSPSASISPSSSVSPSLSSSPSASVSPSLSSSPSSSVSPSSSISPSPSEGSITFTREGNATLPINDTDLSTSYTTQDEIDISAVDGTRVSQTGVGEYMIHQYKNYVGALSGVSLTCTLQSSLSPSVSTTYLQIYNRNTTTWETIDSDSSSIADTNFTLTYNIVDLTDYKDVNNFISCRVYQLAV